MCRPARIKDTFPMQHRSESIPHLTKNLDDKDTCNKRDRVTASRTELLRQLEEALRKVSAQSVLLSDTVARLVGLHSTDLECLDLLYLSGPATAGRLSAHTGLTTGATTAVIDRLERSGWVRRTRDAK